MKNEKEPGVRQARRPKVRPTEETWNACIELGKYYGIAPIDAFSRVIKNGIDFANARMSGKPFYIKEGDEFIELNAFKKDEKTS